jgi:putative DNA-invertase from lambdoid prophage Rac
MRKAQGYFVGGRRGFGYNVIGSLKVPNAAEQALIDEMKAKRAAGASLSAVHRWLTEEQGVKLSYSSMREALLSR